MTATPQDPSGIQTTAHEADAPQLLTEDSTDEAEEERVVKKEMEIRGSGRRVERALSEPLGQRAQGRSPLLSSSNLPQMRDLHLPGAACRL